MVASECSSVKITLALGIDDCGKYKMNIVISSYVIICATFLITLRDNDYTVFHRLLVMTFQTCNQLL